MLIVMHAGNRIESGNHEALMYKNCLYSGGGNTAPFYVCFARNAKIQPGGQQEGQGIRHRLRPDKTRLMEDRAEDEHRRNVDQTLTEDIENLSRKETATISRKTVMSRLKRAGEWKLPFGKMTQSSPFLAPIAQILKI